jgi:carbon storage regulator CsrA
MLVLKRRANELVRIGDSVRLVVLGSEEGRVRLGISAPHDMPISREESVSRRRVAADGQVEPFPSYPEEPVGRIEGPVGKMMVASLEVGERIWLGEDTAITIVRSRGGVARIGVEAAAGVFVYPEEVGEYLYDRELSVFIDPGNASEALLAELYVALSAYYQSVGGSGLEIKEDERRSLVREEA